MIDRLVLRERYEILYIDAYIIKRKLYLIIQKYLCRNQYKKNIHYTYPSSLKTGIGRERYIIYYTTKISEKSQLRIFIKQLEHQEIQWKNNEYDVDYHYLSLLFGDNMAMVM